MKIISGNTICFKSSEEFYYKERSGNKPNTIRRLNDMEKHNLNLWLEELSKKGLPARIRITLANIKPKQGSQEYRHKAFERTLTDISEWEGLHIFSWKCRHARRPSG